MLVKKAQGKKFYGVNVLAAGIGATGGGGGGVVSLNAAGTKLYQASGTSLSYTGLTIAAGTNIALVVEVLWDSSSTFGTGMSMTWNGVALGFIGTNYDTAGGNRHELWGLVNPATGNRTLAMSWTGSVPVFVSTVAFNNVDQTGGTFTFENMDFSVASSLTLGSNTTDMLVSTVSGSAGMAAGSLTPIFIDTSSGAVINAAAGYAAGASPSKSLTMTAGGRYLGVNIRQSGRTPYNAMAIGLVDSNTGATGTGGSVANPATILTSDRNRAILGIMCMAGANAGVSSSPTVNLVSISSGISQPFTLVGGPYANGTVGDIYVFGLVNPIASGNSFSLAWTGSNQVKMLCAYLTGVDQTGGSTTFHNIVVHPGSSAVPSVTTTVPANEMAFAGFISTNNFTSVASGTDGGFDNSKAVNALAYAYTTSSGSQTLSYNPSGATSIAVSVCVKCA
jgi:hypothetical protein